MDVLQAAYKAQLARITEQEQRLEKQNATIVKLQVWRSWMAV